MKKWHQKVEQASEELGWNCSINNNDFCFETWSPAGQDLCVDVRCKTLKELKDELWQYYDTYEPDEEAKLWFGANRGEPSSLRGLLDDMDWCKQAIRDLYDKVNKL